MSTQTGSTARRMTAVLREEETVTPLELFFDLVFVLALTQCTALMAADPTWEGLAKGLLALAVMWWSWVGYAWLTSVVDPEEGAVRLVIFAAMAAFLVAGLCVPGAFGDSALVFALAYGVVRSAHIALFLLASRDDPSLRRSTIGLASSTAIGVGLILAASFADGTPAGRAVAAGDPARRRGPVLLRSRRLDARAAPLRRASRPDHHHRARRVDRRDRRRRDGRRGRRHRGGGGARQRRRGRAVWLYFDVVALVSTRRLSQAEEGRERNELARDSFSYLHFPMVAGIVLVALGLKKTLGHVEDPLELVPAAALYGGVALYLLAHVAFRLRNIQTLNSRRLATAILLLALIAPAVEISALASLGILVAVLVGLIVYETHAYGEARADTQRAAPRGPLAPVSRRVTLRARMR